LKIFSEDQSYNVYTITFDMANNPLNPWLERNKNADLVEVISLYKTV